MSAGAGRQRLPSGVRASPARAPTAAHREWHCAARRTSDDDLEYEGFDDSGHDTTHGDVGCEGRPAGPSSGKGVGGESFVATVPTESNTAAFAHTLWASTKSKM